MHAFVDWLASLTHSLPVYAAILFGLALFTSFLGFLRTVYFVSLGYAFSILSMGILSLVAFGRSASLLALVQTALLALYGLRLGFYLVAREIKSTDYKRVLNDTETRKVPVGLRMVIWVSVGLLYLLMFSPGLFHLAAPEMAGSGLTAVYVGLAIMVLGFGIEAVSDLQKSAHKKKNPKKFCDVGLYRMVRYPNYLGEVTFWSGSFVAALGAYSSWIQWASALTGYVCLVLVMIGSTKRLEKKQQERYGAEPEFQKYSTTVPVLLPLLPIYSLSRVRVLLE
ncbi:MAG: DUF1295 domain-containing protein [Myxococcota bacterium]|jgi:steroid 5-alpha reductase family enzyme|nr:DUF1295 domain-containing protein [Myxococcota bacterium]